MATATPDSPAASGPIQGASDRDEFAINAVRVLSMDAVQQADSGHPGTPMALAPIAYALWTRHMKYNPADPGWPDRDRFVLSCGHASMLLYSVLHLTGYDLSLDDLKHFRQWESKTPGHPEYGYTPGVETTTGPLGQGVGNAVGFAVAEAHLAAVFNREGHAVVDHHTYFICSDGDLMEGVSHEAASFAGHNRLGKLVGFYDDNRITIEGDTRITYTDDAGRRFESYGWHVQHVDDGNDLAALNAAIDAAKAVTDRPSLIVVRTVIGYGSPNRAGSAKAHGSPLGKDEILLTKQKLGWPSMEPFVVPDEAVAPWREAGAKGAALQAEWQGRHDAWKAAFPELAAEFERRQKGELPKDWEDKLTQFTAETGAVASRAASGTVLNAVAASFPEFIGGSADLAESTLTHIKGEPSFGPDGDPTPDTSYAGRNFHYGIREHGMGAVMNGMALHGGIVPYGATFLIFSDYMRPAIRLAALMHRHLVYVFTHDSIGLGEDGPTHQPIEQLTALRCIPGLTVVRPADAGETAEAWRVALTHKQGPVALVLTRQKLAFVDRTKFAAAGGVAKGAYALNDVADPQVVLMGSGSEVELAMKAGDLLAADGIRARVVSVPSMELFAEQDAAYRDGVLPPSVPRVSIEAAHPMSWQKLLGGHGVAIGIERFGASAPYQRVYTELGITAEKMAEAARGLVRPA